MYIRDITSRKSLLSLPILGTDVSPPLLEGPSDGSNRAMLHDNNEYVEPEKFNPNRFLDKNGQLDPNVLDPARMAFGFGRRCVILPFMLRLVAPPVPQLSSLPSPHFRRFSEPPLT